MLRAGLLPVITAMSEAPLFRSAVAQDREAIERLLTSESLPTAGVAEMCADDPSQFVVAYVNERLVAVAGVQACGTDALLRSVAVQRDRQGTGLGRAVVSYAETHASSRGITTLYLLTLTAEQWFPRFGFTRIERHDVPAAVAATVEFASACPASAVTMHKRLGELA